MATIEEMKTTLINWYNKRSENGIIPIYEARNNIVDIDLIDEDYLKYYYFYATRTGTVIATSYETGRCCKEDILCKHRFEWYGCAGCSVKIKYDELHPKNELEGIVRKGRK